MTTSHNDLLDEAEIAELSAKYGTPKRLACALLSSELKALEFNERRRGEVVFPIFREDRILTITKDFYPKGVYRLPSGGIHMGERIKEALHREVREETGLEIVSARFLGIITYYDGGILLYVSYLFAIDGSKGELAPEDEDEGIIDYRWVSIEELERIAQHLADLEDDWNNWGRFRAIVHKFLYEILSIER